MATVRFRLRKAPGSTFPSSAFQLPPGAAAATARLNTSTGRGWTSPGFLRRRRWAASGGRGFIPRIFHALLRVLQEREFERVGGTERVRADVRIIAATNRDLQAAQAAGRFRPDLFYRLNVFPIEVPPLCDRKEDVVTLPEYYVERHAKQMGKGSLAVEQETRDLFQSYGWPGNVRELQNIVERSVILSSGRVFRVDEQGLSGDPVVPSAERAEPNSREGGPDREQKIIEAALAESRGRVWGPVGAAAKLQVPPSTLDARIRKLNIRKSDFKFR
ncbi:MAG TPA: sigma 54-interacting transcriptional regulator [Planctomycetota bacterium]|nr:sigma 54-interacting transcriptional regulator [Planctomycetota bacterium]